MEEPELEHESYGMIGISRVSGCSGPLFGSSIEHQNTIQITISKAKLDRREYHSDSHYKGSDIVNIEMSQSQFAEAITSMNTMGTPCTIRRTWIDGKYKSTERSTFVSKRKQFQEEFKTDIDDLYEKSIQVSDQVQEILNKKSVGKKHNQFAKQLETRY
jgi:hypothetical protein